MNEIVTLNHGSGGRMTHSLIEKIFVSRFGMDLPLTDSAIIADNGSRLAFTTDSYVVDPIFFPGGNIGKLAVCGTINDLAVSGAVPAFIAASFIIEEGLMMKELADIAEAMAVEAAGAGVRIITGDTKVVGRGKCDKIFITTSGIGFLKENMEHISTARFVKPSDKILVNGPVGNHSIAVMGARKSLSFSTPVVSDCASLNHLIKDVTDNCSRIHFMRDITRGGLATVLNELASMAGAGIIVNESTIPVDEPVKGLCEMLGFDPFCLANEGKILIVAGDGEEDKVLGILRAHPLGAGAAIIGEVISDNKCRVIMNTAIGGRRIVDIPSIEQLPRIC